MNSLDTEETAVDHRCPTSTIKRVKLLETDNHALIRVGMTTLFSPNNTPQKQNSRETDWLLLMRVAEYAKRHQHLLILSLILLIPLSLSGAVQPILIGQAISLIRQFFLFFQF